MMEDIKLKLTPLSNVTLYVCNVCMYVCIEVK